MASAPLTANGYEVNRHADTFTAETATGLGENVAKIKSASCKAIINGQILILTPDGKQYTLDSQRIK